MGGELRNNSFVGDLQESFLGECFGRGEGRPLGDRKRGEDGYFSPNSRVGDRGKEALNGKKGKSSIGEKEAGAPTEEGERKGLRKKTGPFLPRTQSKERFAGE